MSEKLIGRDEEKATLQLCLESNRSEFVAVYGRRRVGKTFLVKSLFEDRFTFYATGLPDGNLEAQISNFSDELERYSGKRSPAPENWKDAFQMLYQLVDESKRPGKKIIFLDEIPWMATARSGFLAALDHFWNRYISSRDDVLLIVCGSATSWIIEHIIDNTGGLHNRLTRHIALRPFTLKETEEMLIRQKSVPLTRQQVAESYMIFGGIPYYLSLFQSNMSLYQNVDAIYFQENAPLADEYRNLFRSLFRHADSHIRIVEALARKGIGLTREEISKISKISDGGGLSGAIEELVQCGFVRKYLAFGKKERDRLYQLIDPFVFFHLRFGSRREAYGDNFWIQYSVTPAHAAWSGYSFEQLCLLHLPQIKKALGISSVLTEAYSWRSKKDPSIPGAQIDLVLDRSDGIINLCENKYCAEKYILNKAYAEALKRKRSAFVLETGTRKAVHTTMITTNGLFNNAYASEIRFQITLDHLFA